MSISLRTRLSARERYRVESYRKDRLKVPLASNEALWQESKVRTAHLDEIPQSNHSEHQSELEAFDDVYSVRQVAVSLYQIVELAKAETVS